AKDYNINRGTSFRGISKLYGEIIINRNFKFTSNVGIDFGVTESKEKRDSRFYDPFTFSTGTGRITEGSNRNANLITTNILTFDKSFGNNHHLDVLLGQEAQILTARNV